MGAAGAARRGRQAFSRSGKFRDRGDGALRSDIYSRSRIWADSTHSEYDPNWFTPTQGFRPQRAGAGTRAQVKRSSDVGFAAAKKSFDAAWVGPGRAVFLETKRHMTRDARSFLLQQYLSTRHGGKNSCGMKVLLSGNSCAVRAGWMSFKRIRYWTARFSSRGEERRRMRRCDWEFLCKMR